MTTATRSLWPTDIRTDDVRTPREILQEQAELLGKEFGGLLTGEIVEHASEARRVLGFEVNAPRIPTTVRLFEVHQSPNLEYPARFIPPKDEIPDDLKKRVYRPGLLTEVPNLTSGHWIVREWVADSASEFTDKLGKLVSTSEVKSILTNLLTRSTPTMPNSKQSST